MTTYLLFQALIFLRQNSKDPCPQARSLLLYHTDPGLMQCRPETCPLELLHQMTPDVAILFPFIIFLLILIGFFLLLFKISSSSRVNLASSWLKGSVKWDSTTAWCAVSEHNAFLHQGVGALQTAAMILVFWVQHSEPQEKFPTSNLRACYFLLSPQTQTVCDMGQT